MGYPSYPDAVPAGFALDGVPYTPGGFVSRSLWEGERAERNRIARECAEATQERDRLQELVNRLRPLAEAAIAEDIAEEVADQPDAALNHLIASELEDARKARRAAVADWHLQQLADRAEGRSPLDVAG